MAMRPMNLIVLGLLLIFWIGPLSGCAGLQWRPQEDNPCRPDAADIPPPSEGDLICTVFPDPRDPHLVIKIAEAAYFAKNPQHANDAIKYLGEARNLLAGNVKWEVFVGKIDSRFGNVMFAALGDELPRFKVPQVISPRDKYFLLYAIGKYEGIARAGLAMRAQAKNK
jgi:hypothetical protein